MRSIYRVLVLALTSFVSVVHATKHHFVVGTFSTNFLYTVEYDDEAPAGLTLVATTAVPAASSWLALNHDGTKLYGTDWNAATPQFVSFDVSDPLNIRHEATVGGGATQCSGDRVNSIFVIASPYSPYAVYGNYYYDDAKCGTVFSVHDNGTLRAVEDEYTYGTGSAVHGTAFSPDGIFLYSADTTGNNIWTHRVHNNEGGTLTPLNVIDGPSAGADPRHVVVHGKGKYIYVVMEGSSEVAQYETDGTGKLFFNNVRYPLLFEGFFDPADFWADEVALSANQKYLWATNRARDINERGFISLFELTTDEGDPDVGAIVGQKWLTDTTTSGGFANSVAPAPFDDELAVLTDNSTGFVQIWDSDGRLVSHLDIQDGGGCCANAVWLD